MMAFIEGFVDTLVIILGFILLIVIICLLVYGVYKLVLLFGFVKALIITTLSLSLLGGVINYTIKDI